MNDYFEGVNRIWPASLIFAIILIVIGLAVAIFFFCSGFYISLIVLALMTSAGFILSSLISDEPEKDKIKQTMEEEYSIHINNSQANLFVQKLRISKNNDYPYFMFDYKPKGSDEYQTLYYKIKSPENISIYKLEKDGLVKYNQDIKMESQYRQ